MKLVCPNSLNNSLHFFLYQDFPFCEQYELLLEHLSIIESGTEIINQQSNIKDNSEDILELENEEEWSTCDEDENDATNDKL